MAGYIPQYKGMYIVNGEALSCEYYEKCFEDLEQARSYAKSLLLKKVENKTYQGEVLYIDRSDVFVWDPNAFVQNCNGYDEYGNYVIKETLHIDWSDNLTTAHIGIINAEITAISTYEYDKCERFPISINGVLFDLVSLYAINDTHVLFNVVHHGIKLEKKPEIDDTKLLRFFYKLNDKFVIDYIQNVRSEI